MIVLRMVGGAVVAGPVSTVSTVSTVSPVSTVALLSTRQRSGQELDLGAVSNQWVAEHRLGQTHDKQR